MIKKIVSALLLGLSLQAAWAFSNGGPIGNGGDSWQVPTIGYGLGGDLNAPKNFMEDYRLNTPVVYYAYDANFWGYFRSNGVAAVDSAFAVLNALTNVDNYDNGLSQFPLESRHQNYQAQALGIIDLKTDVLGLMIEQMGLTDPVRYAWTLHNRAHVGSVGCPTGMEYWVIQLNFDFFTAASTTLPYSPYVNGVLYSYQIAEACTGPNPLALAVPFSVDPLASSYSPVASFVDGGVIGWGDYYTGLTRDDMAGLRYLLSTNNFHLETAASGSIMYTISTNFSLAGLFPPNFAFQVFNTNTVGYYYYQYAGSTNTTAAATNNAFFGYGDLASFIGYIQTNNLANVQATYPGVQVSSYSNYFVIATNVSYFFYYTNAGIGSPVGSAPKLAIGTNYTAYLLQKFAYQFANIFTNHFYTNKAKLYTTTVAPAIGSAYPSPVVTNSTFVYTNQIGGDFFVLPGFYGGAFGLAGAKSGTMTNVCPIDIIQAGLTNVYPVTNYLVGGSTNNTLVLTNTTSTTNTTGYSQTVYIVNYFTNYIFEFYPTTCQGETGATEVYQGVKNIKFVRADYDSLVGQYWQPVTNYYTMTAITNSKAATRFFQRILIQPDILLSVTDLGSALDARSLTFNSSNVGAGLAGPGTIDLPTFITFNKSSPNYFNSYGDSMDGTPYFTQTPGGDITNLYYAAYFVWGTYDGSTNAPMIYPNTANLGDLEAQVLMQVGYTHVVTPNSPAVYYTSSVPNGNSGFSYGSIQFVVSGGYLNSSITWTASGLPDGMSLSSDGILSGTPTLSGVYDFTLTLTDSNGRTANWTYTITIQ